MALRTWPEFHSKRWICQAGDAVPSAAAVAETSKTKLGTLEIGRFLAASGVVLAHMPWIIDHLAANPGELLFGGWALPGPIMVEYFFVLSGFVMFTAHHKDFGKISAPFKFWWRRACRLYPVYWLGLALLGIFYYSLLTPYLALQLVALLPGDFTEWVGPAWSLRYEIAFYIMFGLCLLPYIGKPILAGWVIVVFWLCRPEFLRQPLALDLPQPVQHFLFPTAARFFSGEEILFFGGLLAGWFFIKFPLGRAASWVLLGFSLIWIGLSMPLQHWGYDYVPGRWEPVIATGYGTLILALVNLERCGVLRTGKLAIRLGQISYPLYILHMVLGEFLIRWFPHDIRLGLAPRYALLAVSIMVVYAVCLAVTLYFDQPVQRVLRGLTKDGFKSNRGALRSET